MQLMGLTIDRLIIHRVRRRDDDGNRVAPDFANSLINMDAAFRDAFIQRITEVIGNGTKSLDLDILADGDGSMVKCASGLVAPNISDAEFIAASRFVPNKLNEVQVMRTLPGGVIPIFTGSFGPNKTPIVGMIKAELHEGFSTGQNLSVQFINNLFMTPAAKLYKVGIFVRTGSDPTAALREQWKARVYDNLMAGANPDSMAKYFYEAFLGLQVPEDSARLTKKFWESSRKFIEEMDASDDEKHDTLTGLYSYLKVDNASTIDINGFANSFLRPDVRDSFRNHMTMSGLPNTAIVKDLSQIGNKLRKRKLRFNHQVELMAPPAAFENSIEISEAQHQFGDEQGTSPATQIFIKGQHVIHE